MIVDTLLVISMVKRVRVKSDVFNKISNSQRKEKKDVVKDATAGAIIPEGDGYLAALIHFRMIANTVWNTDEAVKRMQALER